MHQHRQRTHQRGFTLIELIVVIVILGVLAAVALPRFVNLQAEARTSKATAIAGSVRAAAALTKAQAMVGAINCATATGTSTLMEGTAVELAYCYPESSAEGIVVASNLNPTADGLTITHAASPNSTTININGASGTCRIVYSEPTVANGAPTVTVTTTGC